MTAEGTVADIWLHENPPAGFPYGWNLAPNDQEDLCDTNDARTLTEAIEDIQTAVKEADLPYPLMVRICFDAPPSNLRPPNND